MNFIVGQRWISHAEANLGLGIIIEVAHRRVTISFPAVEETRTYATDTAPLTRVKYTPGETVTDADDNQYKIIDLEEFEGIITYDCYDSENNKVELSEIRLNCFVRLTNPMQRLVSGQVAKKSTYMLKVDALRHVDRLQQLSVKGLLGTRTELIPHQLYIAKEVSSRFAPRVLLADEVGLGKTIEAGMILHQQIVSGKSERVLIVVPDSLIYQWLVEMRRRFNLSFSLFDNARFEAEKCQDDEDQDDEEQVDNEEPVDEKQGDEPQDEEQKPSGDQDVTKDNEEETVDINPFEQEQLIICGLGFLTENDEVRENALNADWDMVIVDEAHHLHWQPEIASPEYLLIEELSRKSAGLLLLTATPEQAGIEGHFARLRLLDPSRFNSLETFIEEEEKYHSVNNVIDSLFDEEDLSEKIAKEKAEEINKSLGSNVSESDSIQDAVKKLIDIHGTGRVLFRNTRAFHNNFPKRFVESYPLLPPEQYLDLMDSGEYDPEQFLFPELIVSESDWVEVDPRVQWIKEKVKELKKEKVLIICHSAETAVEIDRYLNLYAGIRSTSFYEGLSIIERDKSAAYFADEESGAQVMVCSEIGSEGRNFQFAHHLILFDLPLNPDLIEQRIGRLDRIGQINPILIHIPYLEDTPQEVIFRWFNEGMDIFNNSFSACNSVYEHFQEKLISELNCCGEDLDQFIAETKEYVSDFKKKLEEGRDRLLELNSCDIDIAQKIIDDIEEEDCSSELPEFMDKVFEKYNLRDEIITDHVTLVRHGENSRRSHFPYIEDKGTPITFDRETAISREEVEFISWEHPMVYETLDAIISSEMGNSTICTVKIRNLPPGTLLLESFFTIETMSPKRYQLDSYLSTAPIRFLVSLSGKSLGDQLSYEKLNEISEPVKKKISQAIAQKVRGEIEQLVSHSQEHANKTLEDFKKKAIKNIEDSIGGEISRLESLREINNCIRDDELEFLNEKLSGCKTAIDRAKFSMQAARLIVNK